MAVPYTEPPLFQGRQSNDNDAVCVDPEQPLLDHSSDSHQQRRSPTSKRNETTMLESGLFRAYYLGAICCIGGFLFGYDSGIIGGVLTFKSFEHDYHFDHKKETAVSSLAVALQQLGALLSCFAIWPITHKYGRKWALVACSVVFVLGATLQTINSHSKSLFYVARVIAGTGLGGSSVVVPMFSGEMTPKQIRGQVGSLYQFMFTLGIFTSYWVDYGLASSVSSTDSRQWQIAVGLQILPAALLGLGMLTLKESTRWLTTKGRHTEAWESLKWIRADDSEISWREMLEIRAGVEYEAHAREGFKIKELVDSNNLKRTLTAAAVFTCQQATGATAFAYYGPQYFKLLVGSHGTTDLLLTAIFGAVKVLACGLFVLFLADTLGRRHILTAGALFMAACQITTACVLKQHPVSTDADAKVSSSGVATIALIYIFVIAYNFSWGPLPWPYVAEIFPPRVREPGIGVGVAFQWLFNFVFSLITPYMIENLGWGTFLIWGIFDIFIAAYSWFGLTETRGKTLEEISGTLGNGSETRSFSVLSKDLASEAESNGTLGLRRSCSTARLGLAGPKSPKSPRVAVGRTLGAAAS